jgi:hypothetical protein
MRVGYRDAGQSECEQRRKTCREKATANRWRETTFGSLLQKIDMPISIAKTMIVPKIAPIKIAATILLFSLMEGILAGNVAQFDSAMDGWPVLACNAVGRF